MSLILEALRKSEAERRRGQVPGLHAEPVPTPRPMRDALPPWWWPLLALVAVAVLAVALWLALRPVTTPEASDPGAMSPRAAPAADSNGSVAPVPRQVSDDVPPRPLTARPSVATDDTRESLARPEDPGTEVPGMPRALEPAPPAAATPRSAAVVGTMAGADADTPARGEVAATVPAATPPPIPTPPAAAMAPAPATTTPARAPPLRLSDLDSAQRQQLPPLRMSMHMWAPTQRFAIIDGNRVSEGDRVGEAVVAEITATGVVLDWQGLRLQIPVR